MSGSGSCLSCRLIVHLARSPLSNTLSPMLSETFFHLSVLFSSSGCWWTFIITPVSYSKRKNLTDTVFYFLFPYFRCCFRPELKEKFAYAHCATCKYWKIYLYICMSARDYVYTGILYKYLYLNIYNIIDLVQI